MHRHNEMNYTGTIQSEEAYYAAVYQKLPVVIEKGLGALVWDVDGKEYVDCMTGYGVALAGHCNPMILSAIKDQLDKIITSHSSLYSPARAGFLEKLVSIAPHGLDKVFLSNSGAEANECALKLARKHTGRKEIIAFTGSYHGKTLGSLSATWARKYRDPFEPLLPGIKFARFGDTESVRSQLDQNTAAVIVEPVQGESGVHVSPDSFLPGLRELCNDNDLLLVFDEVQTGLGRTGKMWAGQHWNVTPDIMTLAKGLAGGIPMGATLASSEVMSSLKLGEHSTTFGGNPLSCSAAGATIDYIIKHNLPGEAERKGRIFIDGLNRIVSEESRVLREARGLGLMLGIESRFDVKEVISECLSRGLLTTSAGRNVIRLLPPLIIDENQIKRVLSILDHAVETKGMPVPVPATAQIESRT